MSEAAIVLPTGVAPYNRCHIHPMVVFNILDHHIRRPEADRVIGALLGTISEETGIVEIRNCFPVPHSEGEQVCPLLHTYRARLHPRCTQIPGIGLARWLEIGVKRRWHQLFSKRLSATSMSMF